MRNSALYKEIAADLRNRLIGNQFVGDRLSPERELAKEYNISRITLRNALEVLRQENLIYKKGKSGNYIKRAVAPEKVLDNKNLSLVLINRDRFDLFHSNILIVLENFAKKFNLHIKFASLSNHQEAENFVNKLNENNMTDAVFLGGIITPVIAKDFKRSKIPVVLLGHLTYPDLIENEFDRVVTNNFEYSYMATDYLIRQGCHKLGLINRFSIQFALNNQYGFMKALDIAGIGFKDAMIIRSESESQDIAELENKTISFIHKNKPDGLVVANERMIPEVFSAISKTNEKKDMKVITIGGSHKEFSWNYNLLSINLEKIVKEALKILVQRLRYPGSEYIHYEYNDFKII
jgi:DNA-binding LacI/PurR family transcriptional regulator